MLKKIIFMIKNLYFKFQNQNLSIKIIFCSYHSLLTNYLYQIIFSFPQKHHKKKNAILSDIFLNIYLLRQKRWGPSDSGDKQLCELNLMRIMGPWYAKEGRKLRNFWLYNEIINTKVLKKIMKDFIKSKEFKNFMNFMNLFYNFMNFI